jgi:hypothetical protein
MSKNPVEQELEKVLGKKRFKKLRTAVKEPINDWVVAAAVIAIIAALAATTSILYSKETSPKASINKDAVVMPSLQRILKTSDIASSEMFDIKISNVYESEKSIKGFEIAQSETFLVFNVSIKNKTGVEQNFYPVTQMFVRDTRSGQTFYMAPTTLSNPLQAGSIKPGDTIEGQLSYAIPKTTPRPLLYIDLGWDDIVPVVFSPLQ